MIERPTDIDMKIDLVAEYEKVKGNGDEYLEGRVIRRAFHAEAERDAAYALLEEIAGDNSCYECDLCLVHHNHARELLAKRKPHVP